MSRFERLQPLPAKLPREKGLARSLRQERHNRENRMKMPLSFAAFLFLAGSACAEPYESDFDASTPIEWEIEPSSRPGHVQFEISRRSGGNHWVVSRPVEIASLGGLSPAQLEGSGG